MSVATMKKPVTSSSSASAQSGEWVRGLVKWYDERRHFGWVRSPEGHDVMLHWRALRASGVNPADLTDDRVVRYQSRPVPGKSPEVTALRLV